MGRGFSVGPPLFHDDFGDRRLGSMSSPGHFNSFPPFRTKASVSVCHATERPYIVPSLLAHHYFMPLAALCSS